MFYSRALFFISILFLTSCHREGQVFVELDSSESGIDFFNAVQDSEKVNILDYLYFYNGGGVAAGDINNEVWRICFLFQTLAQTNSIKTKEIYNSKMLVNKRRLKAFQLGTLESQWSILTMTDGWIFMFVRLSVSMGSWDKMSCISIKRMALLKNKPPGMV